MTFNKRSERDISLTSATPLIQENISEQLNSLQERYLEFNRCFEGIKDFNQQLSKANYQEYTKFKQEMYKKINQIPLLLNDINSLKARVNTSDIKDDRLKKRAKEQIAMLDNKIIPKNNELGRIINEIVEKENNLIRTGTIIETSPEEQRSDNSLNNPPSFAETQIVVKDYKGDQEYLQIRQKELEDIKKISAQVVSITTSMKIEAEKQGEVLSSIEDNVMVSKDNVCKAENEIKEAEKITRDERRKIIWLALFILFVVVCIVLIFSLAFWK